MARVLIVDDQPAVCTALQVLMEIHGIDCVVAHTPAEALAALDAGDVGVVIQDMNFSRGSTSGVEGEALYQSIRNRDPHLPVIILTAWTSLEMAVQLIKDGAGDYLAKPWDDQKLVQTVRNLMKLQKLREENTRLQRDMEEAQRRLAGSSNLCGLVYASSAMHKLLGLAVQVAASEIPLLVTGPNGSGKERIADIVHANSTRNGKPFVKVNAGALPDQLMESELFGAEAGAFTGANKLRVGRFEAADGGTLFLDEVGNLSAAGQMKLLRVLQTGEFQRLGSSVTRKVDVRVISATNADLRHNVSQGRFREDLFYRLNVVELRVPPLRDRPEDIMPLAISFLTGPGRTSSAAREFSPQATAALTRHTWPGNVRELQNRVLRARLLSGTSVVSVEDLDLAPTPVPADAPPDEPAAQAGERAEIELHLRSANGVVAKAAADMGLSRQALYRKMDRLGITLERRLR